MRMNYVRQTISNEVKKSMETIQERVEYGLKKATAIQEIRNMAAKIPYFLSNHRAKEFEALWASEGVQIAMPWGCYDGPSAAKRFCFDIGDRNDPDAAKNLAGHMCCYDWCSEMLQIADDLQTARSVWQSSGPETYGKDIYQHWHGGESYWHWMKYGIDFICEDGVWKFWHLSGFPLYRIPYNKSWTDSLPYNGWLLRETHTNHAPIITTPFTWSLDSINPSDQPCPPLPYKTFADVAPGYGFENLPGYGSKLKTATGHEAYVWSGLDDEPDHPV